MPTTVDELPSFPRRVSSMVATETAIAAMRQWTQAVAEMRYIQPSNGYPRWTFVSNEWGAPSEPTVVPENGFDIETVKHTNVHNDRLVLLFMGGQWLKGGWNKDVSPQCFCTSTSGPDARSIQWDRENQPTRWKPLS